MEFGDIIYFILLAFFMILGFFNDSRKKKDKQKQQSEEHSRPYFDVPEEDIPPRRLEPNVLEKTKTPPLPPVPVVEEGRTVFQSSMDLTTDFAKESSLKSSIFVFDADVSYDKDADTQDISEMSDSYLQKITDGEKKGSPHPLLGDLYGDASRKEFIKGLIIGEIMQRKY